MPISIQHLDDSATSRRLRQLPRYTQQNSHATTSTPSHAESMHPPPVTPSPRCFIIGNAAVRGPAPSQATTPHSSAPPQFRSTPRFSFAASQRGSALTAHEHVVSTPPQFTRAGQGSGGAREDVEEEDDDEDRARQSVEGPALGGDGHDFLPDRDEDEDDEGGFIVPPPKRRRLSVEPILSSPPCVAGDAFGDVDDTHAHYEREDDQQQSIAQETHDDDDFEDLLSSNQPVSSPPPTQQQRPATQAPRFLLSTPAKPALCPPAPPDALGPFLKPPRFKPPDEEERDAGAEPLPGQFSPRRRGQKFVAGGLAAEVRGWLVELEGHGAARSVRNPTTGEDGWAVVMGVEEVAGGGGAGVTIVRGRQVGGGGDAASLRGVRMVLGGGEGMSEGLRRGEQTRVGGVVGVRGPVWEVEIEGVRYGVGAAWKVLG